MKMIYYFIQNGYKKVKNKNGKKKRVSSKSNIK